MNRIKELERIGYRFVGKNKHSAIKICEWTRESIRKSDSFCYKQKFYGIKSHKCIQMSPAVFSCTHNCLFCWRTAKFTGKWKGPADKPKEILDQAIAEQIKILQGFWGGVCDKQKLREAMKPNQVAISLVGEPCLYPKLAELIDEIKNREMTAFLVSNGTVPEMIKKLKKHQPTNMYITLAAPNEDLYKKTCKPIIKDGWKRIREALAMLKDFERSVIRLTLAKGLNMINPEEYAELIEEAGPSFVEVKAFMPVGGSVERLPYEAMPRHNEIVDFAKVIEKNSKYRVKDEKSDSRVVLLAR
ncbi:MAG: 4-demethylwyosine synthase TYW1 [Candidatus Aenigmarchaeota archaeon]|nr:4-demethylwyosine synthase TYW1 [Candidatus Aenigmarchaeota archaeon]